MEGDTGGLPGAAADPLPQPPAAAAGQDNIPQSSGLQVMSIIDEVYTYAPVQWFTGTVHNTVYTYTAVQWFTGTVNYIIQCTVIL